MRVPAAWADSIPAGSGWRHSPGWAPGRCAAPPSPYHLADRERKHALHVATIVTKIKTLVNTAVFRIRMDPGLFADTDPPDFALIYSKSTNKNWYKCFKIKHRYRFSTINLFCIFGRLNAALAGVDWAWSWYSVKQVVPGKPGWPTTGCSSRCWLSLVREAARQAFSMYSTMDNTGPEENKYGGDLYI